MNHKKADKTKRIVLAGGCFWGVERYFQTVAGIVDSTVGYANSKIEDPSYEQVCSGETGAVEAVELVYDPEKIGLRKILEIYFMLVDPTSLNKQGNDRGTQYRTGVYWTGEEPEEVKHIFAREQERYGSHFQVEHGKLLNFYPAEDYHQDYLKKNPGGYCHIPIPGVNI